MQQRQLRLGDILDDYCPRERRVTNHAVVAMVDADVKQTRCTTCDAEHDYKHAKVPRQRKKSESPAVLYAHALASAPKKVASEAQVTAVPSSPPVEQDEQADAAPLQPPPMVHEPPMVSAHGESGLNAVVTAVEGAARPPVEEGPVHRRLIRAQLPRTEGQPAPARQAPDFTIRQPAGHAGGFRPRHQRGAAAGGGQFQGSGNRFNSGNGNRAGGSMRGGSHGHNGGDRPTMVARLARRQGSGRKRSK